MTCYFITEDNGKTKWGGYATFEEARHALLIEAIDDLLGKFPDIREVYEEVKNRFSIIKGENV